MKEADESGIHYAIPHRNLALVCYTTLILDRTYQDKALPNAALGAEG